MARLGQPTQRIVYGTLGELLQVDFGPPLHCLALCGETHPLETEILEYFQVKPEEMILIAQPITKNIEGIEGREEEEDEDR